MLGLRLAHALAALTIVAVAGGAQAGCGSSKSATQFAHGGDDAGGDATVSDDGGDGGLIGFGDGSTSMVGFDVEPSSLQTITVTMGQTMPTIPYQATANGAPVSVGWGVDRGNIGTIAAGPSTTGVFAPTGTTGGVVDVLATLNGKKLQRQVLVKLTGSQNGANTGSTQEQGQIPSGVGSLSGGGGVGGVGGEGLGGSVDPGTLTTLQNPSGNGQAQNLTFLYPYDKTVWPRGMIAPLLMWSWATKDADAILLKLSTTSGSFSWTGAFSRPAILTQTGGPFIRHPIPQDVWDAATNTAGGTVNNAPDKLTLSLTVAKGGMAYGPISETWTIAPGRLTGTVYYNSYGTQYVKNWGTNTDAKGHPIGAAILGIRSGDTAPTLVVGQNSSDHSGCRVCHVVSSRGKWLLTQSEQGSPGDGQSYLYDLTQSNVQGSAVALGELGTFAWSALTNDGFNALTNTINPSSSNLAIANSSNGTATSSFWQFGTSPVTGTLTGLPSGVAAGYPSFSPDDKYVTYIDVTGSTQDVHGQLWWAQYDAASHTFSNPHSLYTPPSGKRVGYPVILPDDSGILFETEVRSAKGGSSDGVSDTVMVTRNGARSELWWLNTGVTPPQAVPLAQLNGKGYLPVAGNNHGSGPNVPGPETSWDETQPMQWDDTTLNYEPTVLPVAAGGYAWVVFTSRRLYGNQLTAMPWLSWPQDYDTQDLGQATVKKLWVAAIDLTAPAGSDPSHPAFYLPAQEILAGNSRGFWVLDPCKQDGQSCQTGDQCCNGYCEPNGDGGALICSNMPPSCAGVSDKCTTAANCCDPSDKCINGFCAQSAQ